MRTSRLQHPETLGDKQTRAARWVVQLFSDCRSQLPPPLGLITSCGAASPTGKKKSSQDWFIIITLYIDIYIYIYLYIYIYIYITRYIYIWLYIFFFIYFYLYMLFLCFLCEYLCIHTMCTSFPLHVHISKTNKRFDRKNKRRFIIQQIIIIIII